MEIVQDILDPVQ